jgi:hypothetical protein
MNVLVIPEDFRKDQYILKPLVQAMMTALGKPRANVRVCQDPLLGGISQALDWENIADILDRYQGMVQVFLLMVDRDGEAGRRVSLDDLERRAAGYAGLSAGAILMGEHAWQEVEVWALAACEDLPTDWRWRDIRAERDMKERYFDPYVTRVGLADQPGQGRLPLGNMIAASYPRVRSLCKEDVEALETRLHTHFERR